MDATPETFDTASARSALEGLRVLDLSRVLAGPWAAQILGDFGAQVLKVERPGEGDDTRHWGPPFVESSAGPDYSAYFSCCNRNKEALAIDFSKPEGAEIVRRLALSCDVLIENFRVGQLAKYGLDYATLSAANPGLIYCSVTGFGQTGPYASRGGYDFLIQGMSGLMTMTGHTTDGTAGTPLKVGIPVSDLFTGIYAAVSILVALNHRNVTGEGQHIDSALLDSQLVALSNQAASFLVGGRKPRPMGNEHPTVVPYRDFETADGRVLIAITNDRQFQKFCIALDCPELATDERFTSNSHRVGNRELLDEAINLRTRTWATSALLAALEHAELPAAPINTLEEILSDPHVKSRNLEQVIQREDGVGVPVLGYPHRLSRTPATLRSAPPRIGQDTRRILGDMLGLSEAELDLLQSNGTIADGRPAIHQPILPGSDK